MTRNELEVIIDNLPIIGSFTGRRGSRCVGFSGGPNNIGQILLDTGEMVKTGIYVNGCGDKGSFKRTLKDILLPKAEQVIFMGVGIWHK
jgi:hypothetical protein